MLVTIHQPHYLPWLPYLGKIASSDAFILLDDVDFTRNGWQNRNKIKTAQGPLVLTVPVEQKLGQTIQHTRVSPGNWQRKHWSSLRQAYAQAPHFAHYAQQLEAFYTSPWQELCGPVCDMITWLMGQLGMSQKVVRSSELQISTSSTQRLIDLVKAVGGTGYLSGSFALSAYLEPDLFAAQGLELQLYDWKCPEYSQLHPQPGFVTNLATLDALFNVGPQATLSLLHEGSRLRSYQPA